uniref:CD180 antigen n=1 Tax=Centroberyx gerrardi TaxID=166262 RepID=UPI003AAD7890
MVTPLSKGVCKLTATGYDCSDQNLQAVPGPDGLPSATKILDFSFNHLPALYNTTFSRLTQLVSLDLTRCKINWIFENSFQNQKHLESLILIGNTLMFVADDALIGPLALSHLRLSQTSMDDLKLIPYNNLMSLETLELGDNDIHSLRGLQQFNWKKMTTLNLQLNAIQNISAAEVAVLQNGRGLSMSFKSNSIVYIEPKAFELVQFNSLDFNDCFSEADISVILAGLAGVKTNILSLGVFEQSQPSTIKAQSLQALCDITVKDLRFQLQHFSDITDTPFHCLSGLEKLDLTRAHLDSLPATVGQMKSLSKLILNENKFQNVCHTNAMSLPSLTALSMRGNQHKSLLFSDGCLSGLSKLELLDLSHSKLLTGTECCEIQLTGLSQLQKLNLSYNSQMKWSALPFREVSDLRQLDCSRVNVTYETQCAEGGPFQNLHHLKWLGISWRFLNLSCQSNLLEGLQNLEHMSLSGSYFKDGVISNPEMFKHVPLLQNLVLSDCGLVSIDRNMFTHLSKLTHADLSGNRLVVVYTNVFYSLEKVLLNFAMNDIKIVDLDSVKGLGEESKLDLSDNPLVCNCSNVEFISWMQSNVNKMTNTDRTRCGESREALTDVHLNCTSFGILGIGLVIVFIGIAFIIIWKVREKYKQYENV